MIEAEEAQCLTRSMRHQMRGSLFVNMRCSRSAQRCVYLRYICVDTRLCRDQGQPLVSPKRRREPNTLNDAGLHYRCLSGA